MSPLVVVVLIVLVDLLGFTMVMPLLAPFAKEYNFTGTQIGLILAAYPLFQLIAGPILGRLSDRFGRRPVLAVSQAGTAISFVILGLSREFWVMLLARILDGASGGNILVAQAYVADITKPENRSKGLGMIGAAFGVGFVLGPLLSGILISLPVPAEWRLRLPFLVAAGFSTIAWILVLTHLPESRPADGMARSQARVITMRGLLDLISLPGVGWLVLLSSLNTLAFAFLEGTFSLFLPERLGLSPRAAAFAFAYLGLISAIVQGGFIRRLVPRFGEPRLILAGLVAVLLGYLAMTQVWSIAALAFAVLLIAVGQGLVGPSLSGLLSRITPHDEQGAIFGTLSSAQTLARMGSYLIGNMILGRGLVAMPYALAATLTAVGLGLAVPLLRSLVIRETAEVEAEVEY